MQLISDVLGLGWNLVRCQNQRRSHRRNSDWNCFGREQGRVEDAFPAPLCNLPHRQVRLGLALVLQPAGAAVAIPAASSHSLVLPLLRHHFPGHNQHQELGVAPVLQMLINEPSLGSVGLPSPWNRILLVHLPLHSTAAFSLLSICKLVQGPRSANKFAASSWRAWRFGRILGKYLPASTANLVNTFHDREMLSLAANLG